MKNLTNERLEEVVSGDLFSSDEQRTLASETLSLRAQLSGLASGHEKQKAITRRVSEESNRLFDEKKMLTGQLAELRGQAPFGYISKRCSEHMHDEEMVGDNWPISAIPRCIHANLRLDVPLYADPVPPAASQPAPIQPSIPVWIRHALQANGVAEILNDARKYDFRLSAGQWKTLVNNWYQTFIGLSEGFKSEASQPYTVPDDYFSSLVSAARTRADKAIRKFPQPNYVLNKVAEESGEVIKAVIHYTEGREEWSSVEGEIIDNLAMLIRLVTEGDQVIGFTPPDACRAAMLQLSGDALNAAKVGSATPEAQAGAKAALLEACKAGKFQLEAPKDDYPETLPCDVLLAPGVRIGKGCPTRTLFLALNSRAANVAALEAMTPEERKDHDAAIEEFRTMLGISAPNSPVIPDGWALVPIEPTEDMVIDGFESRPDEFFSSQEDWDAYKAMSGCKRAAHRARLCWAAMIAAAPLFDNSPQRITSMLPERDDMGFWCHPDRLETPFDEDEAKMQDFRSWFAERGMEVDFTYMNQVFCEDCVYDAADSHPAHHWNPTPPDGDGWVLTAIFDTEEGPCAEWIRYVATNRSEEPK